MSSRERIWPTFETLVGEVYNNTVTNSNFVMDAQEIYQLRNRLGYSRQQFGDVLGVSRVQVFRWEKGEQGPGPYRAATMRRIEEQLNKRDREQFAQALLSVAVGASAGALLAWLFGQDNDED